MTKTKTSSFYQVWKIPQETKSNVFYNVGFSPQYYKKKVLAKCSTEQFSGLSMVQRGFSFVVMESL